MQVAKAESSIHKTVFEVRYAQGFLYLDRCGAVMNRIAADYPDWLPKGDAINPQNAPLVNVQTGTHFNFGTMKYDFSLDQPISQEFALTNEDVDNFIDEVSSISKIVHEELQLTKFVREGFRIWYLFPMDSEAEAEEWISGLRAFSIADSVASAFHGTLESQGHVAVIKASDRKFRISVNVVERLGQLDLGSEILQTQPRNLPKGQREALLNQIRTKRRLLANPGMAVMVDVDAFLDDPIEVDPADFIRQSFESIEKQLPDALIGGKP